MELQDIFISGDIETTIENLKQKTVEVPSWSDLEKEYDQSQHPIISDKSLRPDDKIGPDGKRDVVARITCADEKIYTRRIVETGFTVPVSRVYDTVDSNGGKNVKKEALSKALEGIYEGVHIDEENINRMTAYFAACEVLTVWYAVETGTVHTKYGFPTKFKLRCRSYSPMPGKWSRITQADLYPLFDEYDDMVAMSFEYVRTEGEDEITYFETYTATNHYRWKNADGGWEEEVNEAVIIGKIPCIYLHRPLPIWDGISDKRNEKEFAKSRFSDLVRKNSAPMVVVEGELIGDKPVGDKAREVYQVQQGGSVDTVAPAFSHEGTKALIDMLNQDMEEDTQLVYLSPEKMAGLGAISGEARKTLLWEPHQRIGIEKYPIIAFFERENSVLRTFLPKLNPSLAEVSENNSPKQQVNPFVQSDELAEIEKMEKATGGKAILSRKTAIAKARLVDDPDAEFALIEEEERIAAENNRMVDSFEAGY